MQNAYIERKNGSMRRELLNPHIFHRLSEAREMSEIWEIDYNTERPQKSLEHLSPVLYAQEKERQGEIMRISKATGTK
jgi:putative transposase